MTTQEIIQEVYRRLPEDVRQDEDCVLINAQDMEDLLLADWCDNEEQLWDLFSIWISTQHLDQLESDYNLKYATLIK